MSEVKQVGKQFLSILIIIVMVVSCTLTLTEEVHAFAATTIFGSAVLFAISAALVGLGYVQTDPEAWDRLVQAIWYNERLMAFKSGVLTFVQDGITYIEEAFLEAVSIAAQGICKTNEASLSPDRYINIPDFGRFPVLDVNATGDEKFAKLDTVIVDMMDIKTGSVIDVKGFLQAVTYVRNNDRPSFVSREFNIQYSYPAGGSLGRYTYDSSYDNVMPFTSSQDFSYYSPQLLTSDVYFFEPYFAYQADNKSYTFYFNTRSFVHLDGKLSNGVPFYFLYSNKNPAVSNIYYQSTLAANGWLEDKSGEPVISFLPEVNRPSFGIDETGKDTVAFPGAWAPSIPGVSIPHAGSNVITRPLTIPIDKTGVKELDQDKAQSGAKAEEAVKPDTENALKKKDIDKIRLPSSLKDYFPFCIPFDLIKGFKLLVSPAKKPIITIPLKIPGIATQNLTIDLTTYEQPIVIIRWFLMLIFVGGLASATSKFIKW